MAPSSGAADSKSFYYVRVDENHRTAAGVSPCRRRRTQKPIGSCIEETDPAWFVTLRESRCGRFAVVSIHGHDASECHLIDLTDAEAKPRRVAPREPRLRYDVEPHGELIYIHANADGAEDFAIFSAPLACVSRDDWREVVPHRPGRMIVIATGLRRSSRLGGTRGLAAAPQNTRAGERRRARDRLRGRGLFAASRTRARIRHDDAALHLFVDDDPGLRSRITT